MSINKKDILIYGSCRLNFNMTNFNLVRPNNTSFIHNHIEILNIINYFQKTNIDNNHILSNYSKLKNSENAKNNIFKEIEFHDIILLEICTTRTYYEYTSNELYISSNIYIYIHKYVNNFSECDYIKFGNTSQTRDDNIESIFFRKDNIILLNKNLYNLVKIGNYVKNKEFVEINYDKEHQETVIKIKDMPNNYFKTFSIEFDSNYTSDILYSVNICITCDSNKDIFIKYYNETEYIYTDQKVNSTILIKNLKNKISIGFYKKMQQGK